MCIYIYINTYIYIYIYICVYMFIYTPTHANITLHYITLHYTTSQYHIQKYINKYIYIYMHMCLCVYACMHTAGVLPGSGRRGTGTGSTTCFAVPPWESVKARRPQDLGLAAAGLRIFRAQGFRVEELGASASELLGSGWIA